MRLALILAVLFMSGCASFTSPDNEIRITEYGNGILPGEIGGCRIIQQGDIPDVEILYQGDRCKVYKAPKPRNPVINL